MRRGKLERRAFAFMRQHVGASLRKRRLRIARAGDTFVSRMLLGRRRESPSAKIGPFATREAPARGSVFRRPAPLRAGLAAPRSVRQTRRQTLRSSQSVFSFQAHWFFPDRLISSLSASAQHKSYIQKDISLPPQRTDGSAQPERYTRRPARGG